MRELENVLERVYILETGGLLSPESFTDTLDFSSKIIHSINDGMALPINETRQNAIDGLKRACRG